MAMQLPDQNRYSYYNYETMLNRPISTAHSSAAVPPSMYSGVASPRENRPAHYWQPLNGIGTTTWQDMSFPNQRRKLVQELSFQTKVNPTRNWPAKKPAMMSAMEQYALDYAPKQKGVYRHGTL